MKNQPSRRKVVIANLTLLALAIVFGLSLFFAAHFYAVPLLTFLGSWAIAHIGLTTASILAGAVGAGSLLAISAEYLQRGSVSNFYKVLAGSVLNLVTLFAFRKQIQARLGLSDYPRQSIVIGAGSKKDQILLNTSDLKQDTEALKKGLRDLSQRLANQPTTSSEHTTYTLPPIYVQQQPTPTATTSSSTSAVESGNGDIPKSTLFVEASAGKGKEKLAPLTPPVSTSTQSQAATVR
jgi:hypothetical protein